MNTISRRHFLKSTAVGLTIGFHWPTHLAQAATPEEKATLINAWLQIAPDDSITVLIAHSEMGQGVYTALPMLVAEELEADWRKIRITQSPVDAIYKNPLIGLQATGGSTTIRSRWQGLRVAGAQARMLLIAAAADQWQVPAAACQAANGIVTHIESGKTLSYGQLASAAAQLVPPENPPLKSPADFKIIGQPIKRLDTPAKVDGSAVFGIDVRRPNMLHATVKQAPVFGAQVKQYDTKAAQAIPGVKAVVDLPNGVAVLANNYWQAKKGLEALKVSFTDTEHSQQTTDNLMQTFKAALTTEKATPAHSQGDVSAALQAAKTTLTAEYSVPYLAHATMEPMSCTADVTADHCTVWAPTQAQGIAQQVAAQTAQVPIEKVTIHTTYLGGGFGRRFEMDFVVQAVLLSKAVQQPVKVVWSREEDMQQDRYRPATMAQLTAAFDETGQFTALKSRIVNSSIFKRVMPQRLKDDLDPVSVEGLTELSYAVPHQLVDYVMKNTHVPVGFWRSVGHSHNAFFIESFIDELAHHQKQDPYQFRRTLLRKKPRFLKVLETLADKSAWQKPAPKGQYHGMAIHQSFGSIAGEVATVSVSEAGVVTVHTVVCVIDCGIAVNPDTVVAQMESGIVYGLGALKEAITIKNGRVEQSNFHDFPVLRIADMPQIDVHIIPSEAAPGGIGEPATPPILPAVTNAIFAATSKRIRHLPLDTDILKT